MASPSTHTSAASAELDACPRCGSPHDPAQEYCLECGLRLPRVEGMVGTLGGAWRRRLRWYPGDWIWLAAGLLAVAAAGAGAAILATRGEATQSTFVRTTTPGVTTTQTVAPTTTASPPPPPPSTATTTSPPATPNARLIQWPAGRSGWTIVLRSFPTPRGRQAALAEAKRAVSSGVDAGVLDSSDFSSLHPGYFVVFSGVYATEDKANAARERAASHGYDGAYVRQVSP